MRTKLTLTLLICLWTLGLAQCGSKKQLSSDVKFVLVPEDPVIINADLTLNPNTDNERVISKPWFLFSARVENKTDNLLNLVTITFKGRGIKNGAPVSYKGALDPGSACYDPAGLDSRSYVAIIQPGQTYVSVTDECDETTVVGPPADYEGWYIHGLPEADTPIYTFDVSGEGWFVDEDNIPIERLNMVNSLVTQ